MVRRSILLVLALACAPSHAFLWFGKRDRAGLLWIPSESFSDWEGLSGALRRHKKLSFTAALTPAMATVEARASLQPFVAEGRLEIAFRLQDDPVLPLIHDHPSAARPQDALEILAAGLRAHRDLWGEVRAGFVPAAGKVHPGLFPLLRSLDLAWVATGAAGDVPLPAVPGVTPEGRMGSPGKSGPQDRRSYKGMPLASCSAVKTDGRDLTSRDLEDRLSGHEVLVIDEAAGAVAEGAWLRLLSELRGGAGVLKRLELVADAVGRRPGGRAPAGARPGPAGAGAERPLRHQESGGRQGAWPDWTGEEDFWSRAPEQKVAWRLYGDAARTLSESRNSGVCPKALEAATAALRQAQASRFYRILGGAAPREMEEADRELRKRLISVYKRLRRPVPESLLLSVLSSAKTPGQVFEAQSQAVPCRLGPDWLSCDNPVRRPAADEDPRHRIVNFHVRWDDASIVLTYRMGRVIASTAAPHGFEGLTLGTYIDFNHVARAGSTRLLESGGAPASISPEDAWEAAVEASGWGWALHRANPRGDPVLESRGAPQADPGGAQISVSLPRTRLRGNPALWGYVVTAAEPAAGGAILRGALAGSVLRRRINSGGSLRLNAVRANQGL